MALLLHIIIALISVGYTSYLYFSPSPSKFHVSYGLVFLTIASGSYLIVTKPAVMVHACTMGLIYIAIVLVVIAGAHRKLVHQTDR